MNPPLWLAELHRRWQAARGKRTTASSRAFGIGWIELLESAGIVSAEDQQTAKREAESLEKEGRLVLKRHKFRRYLIERVTLPAASESWLHERFGSVDPVTRMNQAMEVILRASAQHTRWPVEWKTLLLKLHEAYGADRNVRPFSWQRPEQLRLLLQILRQLSAGEWTGVPIRSASVAMGLDSKALERHRRSLEAGLSLMFGSATPLESLGLVTGDSMVRVHGPLLLVFESFERLSVCAATELAAFADSIADCVGAAVAVTFDSRPVSGAHRPNMFTNKPDTSPNAVSSHHSRNTTKRATTSQYLI